MNWYKLKFRNRESINCGINAKEAKATFERLSGEKVKSIRELTESEIELVRSGEYPGEKV